MTEPRPADVRRRPSARKPWKAAPSTRAKAATAPHAAAVRGHGLPWADAQATRTAPAGSRRMEATNRGVVWGSRTCRG